MKLKEAQMLGVLALIAVGIILLCMWGGGGSSESTATSTDNQTAAATSSPTSETDVAALTNELLNAPADGSAAAPKDATVSMAVGGKTPAQPTNAAEDASVRAMIERSSPDKIPLVQPRPDAATTMAAVATTTHIVRSGDTLTAISQKYYGTRANWKLILDANSSVVKKATDLKPNMKLVIPAMKATTARAAASDGFDQSSLLSATTVAPIVATVPAAGSAPAAAIAPTAASAHATAPAHAPAAAPAPAVAVVPVSASSAIAAPRPAIAVADAAAPRTHTVAKGDSLFRIALKYYGDGNRFKDILAANRNVLTSAQDLRPGMKLVIP